MTTPIKNTYSFDFHHPSTTVQQYPSQSEDYIPLDVSYTRQQKNSNDNFHRNINNRTNHHQQYQQQRVFNKNYQRNENRDRNKNDTNRRSNEGADEDPYFHISMLEDPWKNLIQRMDAIRNSEISLNTSDN